MDINKHLKELNLASIKRNRNKSVPTPVVIPEHEHTVDLERFKKDGQLYCKDCNEMMIGSKKIMNIKPTDKKEAKTKQPKVENTPPKKGFWSKLLGALKSIIFRM